MISSVPPPEKVDVVVVGAGLAGLSCARHLDAGGVEVHVLEGGDAVGGRVRTDEVDGFRLDRGFQVLLTAYDEVWRLVDREALDLGCFDPGSRIRLDGSFHALPDPFRAPSGAWAALRAPVGSFADKFRVARLRAEVMTWEDDGGPVDGPLRSTLDELRARRFGPAFIDTFFRSFLGGVFLDRSLSAPASLFRYLFRCFSTGEAALPAGGMQRLSEAVAGPLRGRITLEAPVAEVGDGSVTLASGRTIRAERVVVATDAVQAAALVGTPIPSYSRAVTAWFAAPTAPVDDPVLVLDGEGEGPVNHLAVVSRVTRGLAPPGSELVAASGVGAEAGPAATFGDRARTQLRRWFGPGVSEWRWLHTHDVPHALPRRDPQAPLRPRALTTSGGVHLAGDDREFAAIQGALRSGRRVAESILGA